MNDNQNNNSNRNINNEFEDKNFNGLVAKYGGAFIGGLVALILCFTELYKILVCIVIVCLGIFIGNYVQKNKSNVKEKLKEFIDKF